MTNETCTKEWQWHNKSEVKERELETNENKPTDQERHIKLLMESKRRGGERAPRELKGQRVERATKIVS